MIIQLHTTIHACKLALLTSELVLRNFSLSTWHSPNPDVLNILCLCKLNLWMISSKDCANCVVTIQRDKQETIVLDSKKRCSNTLKNIFVSLQIEFVDDFFKRLCQLCCYNANKQETIVLDSKKRCSNTLLNINLDKLDPHVLCVCWLVSTATQL